MRFPQENESAPDPTSPSGLVEHYFRHEYGRLVAILVRHVGLAHLEAVEDSVQASLLAALKAWTDSGVPRDPSAWLYRVARNNLSTSLRNDTTRRRLLETVPCDEECAPGSPTFRSEVHDELLRMLFVCCDDAIPPESRLVLALKTLCGFNTAEIALRLFTTEANVHKRLARGREKLRTRGMDTSTPPLDSLRARLPSVHGIIYLLFNEGYLSTHAEHSIRAELCEEAIRLGTLLGTPQVGASSSTFALVALMHFHAARLAARQDAAGGLLLLEEQDRARWDTDHLRQGSVWLERAAHGEVFTRFHAEAGIAAEHCFAPSFKETRWQEIVDLYSMLERIDPSPFHALHRAVAVAELHGPDAALLALQGVVPPTWLEGHYLWAAVLADLHLRTGNLVDADRYREQALATAPSQAVRDILTRRFARSGALGV